MLYCLLFITHDNKELEHIVKYIYTVYMMWYQGGVLQFHMGLPQYPAEHRYWSITLPKSIQGLRRTERSVIMLSGDGGGGCDPKNTRHCLSCCLQFFKTGWHQYQHCYTDASTSKENLEMSHMRTNEHHKPFQLIWLINSFHGCLSCMCQLACFNNEYSAAANAAPSHCRLQAAFTTLDNQCLFTHL